MRWMEWCILCSHSVPEGEDRWRAGVHVVLNCWVPQNVGNLLVNWWVSKHMRCSIGLVGLLRRPRYPAMSSTAGRTGLLWKTGKSDVTLCHFRCFQPAIFMWNCAAVLCVSQFWGKQKILRERSNENDGNKRMERQRKGSRGLEAYCKGDQGPPRAVAPLKKKEQKT